MKKRNSTSANGTDKDAVAKKKPSIAKKTLFPSASEKKTDDIPLLLKEPITNLIKKHEIISLFEVLFSTKLQYDVLTDVNVNQEDHIEFNVVGRPKTIANNKQMRHVTPYVFIKNLIEAKITNSGGYQKMITSFHQIIKLVLNHKKGFVFTEEDLDSSGYEKLKPKVKKLSRKLLNDKENSYLLVSPEKLKEDKIFTPTKIEKANSLFREKNPQYIDLAIKNLANIIENDHNTTIIATEILSRFIFQIFNANEDAVFPQEGNTENYEIRLYNSAEEAKKPKKGEANYTLTSAKALKKLYEEDPNLVNEIVRLVDCEGSNTTKIIKSLDLLDAIITEYNTTKNKKALESSINDYNKCNSKVLVLANSDNDLADYNNPLTIKNYLTKSHYHLAKLIYSVFDLKVLEEIVLIKERKNGEIQIYNGAKSKTTSKYSFFEGAKNRKTDIEEAKYSKKVKFRDEKTSTGFLEKKLVEHFTISTIPYSDFAKGFLNSKTVFLEDALTVLIQLAAIDYAIEEEETKEMVNDALTDFHKLMEDPYLHSSIEDMSIFLNSPEGTFINTTGENSFNFDVIIN